MPQIKRQTLLELNTRLWLKERPWAGDPPDLANIPDAEIDRWAELGIDWIWLMGVWEPSPAGRLAAQSIDWLVGEVRGLLHDFTIADVVASPYAVHRYVLNPTLGRPEPEAPDGPSGSLGLFRRRLNVRGIKLMLDFVPNHTATDHPWIDEHPEYYVQGSEADVAERPHDYFFTNGGRIIACGRDPYFPPWTDTAQIHHFNPEARAAMIREILRIARCCDGLRCDMAMLATNGVFERVWGERLRGRGDPHAIRPREEFWVEVARAVRAERPDFVLMAEVYWNLEAELREMGFDFTYDKVIYDQIVHGEWDNLRARLGAGPAFHTRNTHFIENHDEPRARAAMGHRIRPATALVANLPGITLHHQGQWEGFKQKWPVQLGRDPHEPIDEDLLRWNEALLKEMRAEPWRSGEFTFPAVRSSWPGDESWRSIFAVLRRRGDEIGLLVVNLGWDQARAFVDCEFAKGDGPDFRFSDPLTGEVYDRGRGDLALRGLYVQLDPGRLHFFRVGTI